MPRRRARVLLALAAAAAPSACLSAGRQPGFELTEGRARWIADRVARLRGADPTDVAPVDVEGRAEVVRRFAEEAEGSFREETARRRVRADKALGLLPPQAEIGAWLTMADLGIAGAYDAESKRVVLVGDLEGGAFDDRTLAHELTHAIDDRRFDLLALRTAARGNTDRALATLALAEGSALAVEVDLALSESYEDLVGGMGGFQASRLIDDLESDLGLLARVRGDRARAFLRRTPLYLRERLVFPYSRGLDFVRELRKRRGTAGVDAAFRDPPLSTEQILHPSKLADRRDDPVAVHLAPDALPGTILYEDTLGELGIRQVLRTRLSKNDANAAAAGWGGDRYALVDVDGRDVLAWHTEWDRERDAREFAKLADVWLSARYGRAPFWRSELGFDDVERPDGYVAEIRRWGSSVAIVDGAPPGAGWAERLLERDEIERPTPSERSIGARLAAPLVDLPAYDDGSGFRLLGGLLAARDRREGASSFSLLGGVLADVSEDVDGERVSFLGGLISWRTAPRQELTRVRVGISAYGEDNESYSTSLLPIVNAPAFSRAPGSKTTRLALVNLASVRHVDFDEHGKPTEKDEIAGDTSFLLGIVGRSWADDHAPDGTPFRASTLYGPLQLVFAFYDAERGPLGPAFAKRAQPASSSAPASGPASRARIQLEPGDVEESATSTLLGDLLLGYRSRTLKRDGRTIRSASA
ncbi:MAG TPA: hypothetical protein VKE69_15165, partial [Planctomycetota bacterium]|nr:hypothetical protein [Planctomycetota bacterium]